MTDESKTAWIEQEIAGLKQAGLFNTIRTLSSPQGAWLTVDGSEVLNFCSNNYLGLANHPKLVQRAKQAIDELGIGPAAVRTIAGTMSIHLELERRLAAFKRVKAAISFQSGFTANLATIPALVSKEDIIFSDEPNHASIIDGCRLSGARVVRYTHCDAEDLRRQIEANERDIYRRALIVTDGVFSMDGVVAPLDRICELADRYDALVMVDDSHATGFMGKTGRGTAEHFGVAERIDITTSTLGKALGGASGGYTCASAEVVDWLRQRSRPYLFSNSVAPMIAASSIAVLDLLERDNSLQQQLHENAAYFRARMTERGFELKPGEHPIIPVMLGDAKLATAMADALLKRGIYVIGFSFPVVPKGEARIRTQMSAGLTRAQLDTAIEAFTDVGRELGVIH